jgi:hypothetical protein
MFMEFRNGVKMRKDNEKPGPSGVSRNHAFSLPAEWGGRDCILKIDDLNVVKEMKEQLGGHDLISFSTPEFAVRAQAAYDSLEIIKLTQENVWSIFTAMLPLVFDLE